MAEQKARCSGQKPPSSSTSAESSARYFGRTLRPNLSSTSAESVIGRPRRPSAAHFESRALCSNLPACRSFFGEVGERLQRAGFRMVKDKDVQRMLASKGLCRANEELRLLDEHEVLFILGGRDSSRSNFFVFMKFDPHSCEVRVSYTNPLETSDTRLVREARGIVDPVDGKRLKFKELYVDEVFSGGDVSSQAQAVAERALKASEGKDPEVYRCVTHLHWGYMKGPGYTQGDFPENAFTDDGVSDFRTVLKRAIHFHTDVLMDSPHNSVEPEKQKVIAAICEFLGIVKTFGFEATTTLRGNHGNGPHTLVFAGSLDAAQEIKRELLDAGSRAPMVSIFKGMPLDEFMRITDEHLAEGDAVRFLAHPMNYNSNLLHIYAIGLISAVEKGYMDLNTALQLAEKFTSVCAWNPSISESEMHLDNPSLASFARDAIRRQGSTRLTANTFHYAFAKMLAEKGVALHFDNDEHKVKRNWGSDNMGQGHTNITITCVMNSLKKPDGSTRKPTSEELVSWLARGELKTTATVFCEKRGGAMRIVRPRTKLSREAEAERKKLLALQTARYAGEMAATIPWAILHGIDLSNIPG